MKARGPIVYNESPANLIQVELTASVGAGSENNREDVICIQSLLNLFRKEQRAQPALTVDGLVGPRTLAAIADFQKAMTGYVDRRIDPGQRAMRALVGATVGRMPALPAIPRIKRPDPAFMTMYRALPSFGSTIPPAPIQRGSPFMDTAPAPTDWFDTPLTGWTVETSGAVDVGVSFLSGIRGTIIVRNETDNSRWRITYTAIGAGLSTLPIGFDFSDESMKSFGSRVFKGLLGSYPLPATSLTPAINVIAFGANIGPGWGVAHVCFNGFVICVARCWLTGFQVGMPGVSATLYNGMSTLARLS